MAPCRAATRWPSVPAGAGELVVHRASWRRWSSRRTNRRGRAIFAAMPTVICLGNATIQLGVRAACRARWWSMASRMPAEEETLADVSGFQDRRDAVGENARRRRSAPDLQQSGSLQGEGERTRARSANPQINGRMSASLPRSCAVRRVRAAARQCSRTAGVQRAV